MWVKTQVSRPTHNLTQHGERSGNDARTPGVKYGALAVYQFSFLHHLRHETAHGPDGLVLLLTGGVGKARVVVPQHGEYRFHIHAVLQGHGRKSVPLWHNKDKSKNPYSQPVDWFVLILFPSIFPRKVGITRVAKK